MAVDVNVAYGQFEDSARLKLYDPNTYQLVAEASASTIFGFTVEGTTKGLIDSCLRKLADILKSKRQ
ncbi:MAG TPA: hypothetical protein GXX51_01730 [Firmicutes bacterium]|nr:hypothetical protein [Bacillota bacterium]